MLNKFLPAFFLALLTSLGNAQEPYNVQPAFPNLFSEFQNIRDFSMTEEGKEVYFTAQSFSDEISIIIHATKNDDSWNTLQLLKPSGKFKDLEPFLAPDGLKLYFASNRPLAYSSETKEDFDIWYVERSVTNGKWSEPKNIGESVNSEFNEFYPSVSSNGNLYFTSDRPEGKGKDDIYKSEWIAKTYATPTSLSASINTGGYEFNAYISPNEDFLIFSGYNREDGFGSGDLYVSLQHKNGDWSDSKNLGKKINSEKMDYCPFIDIKTNTLYFTSTRSGIKANDFHSVEEFKEALDIFESGQSKIYKSAFNLNQFLD